MTLSDNDIWPVVKETIHTLGSVDGSDVLPAALDEICGRFGVEDREAMKERLDRLWNERLNLMGAG